MRPKPGPKFGLIKSITILCRHFKTILIGWEEVHETTGTVKTLNNITIAKQLSTLKTFLGYARRQGIKVNDGYKEFSIKKDQTRSNRFDPGRTGPAI